MKDTEQYVEAKALIDSGCTGCAINRDFINKHVIKREKLQHQLKVLNADGKKTVQEESRIMRKSWWEWERFIGKKWILHYQVRWSWYLSWIWLVNGTQSRNQLEKQEEFGSQGVQTNAKKWKSLGGVIFLWTSKLLNIFAKGNKDWKESYQRLTTDSQKHRKRSIINYRNIEFGITKSILKKERIQQITMPNISLTWQERKKWTSLSMRTWSRGEIRISQSQIASTILLCQKEDSRSTASSNYI